MSSTPTSDRHPGRSRIPVILFCCALLVISAVMFFIIRSKLPHLFDREETNTAELGRLQTAALTPAPTADTGSGWWQWLGPTRDGRAPAGPLRTDWEKDPPTVLWTAPCGGGYSSLAVVGGKVYTQDRKDGTERVLCLDAATGKEIGVAEWPVDYGSLSYPAGPRATPTVHDGKVYALGASGIFVCLKAKTPGGSATEIAWKHDLPAEYEAAVPQWGYASSPLIEGDLVVVQAGGKKGSVIAFDRETGSPRWAAGKEPNGYSSPVAATIAGVRMIVAVTGKTVVGLRPADGQVLWSLPWETRFEGNIATPIVVGEYVFVSSAYQKGCMLVRLEEKGGAIRAERVYFRSNRVMRNHHSTCMYRDGYLYGYDDEVLRCVDLRKGEVVADWEGRRADNRFLDKGSLILAGDHLIGLTQSGTLYLADADPKEFRLRGSVERVLDGADTWALPVLVDGRIYLRDATKVICLDVAPVRPAGR